MNFFSERTGQVVLVPDVGFPLTVGLEAWPGGVPMKSVITSASISSQGNYQFMHTLRNLIYVYVFGEKIGEINIGGISFPGICGDPPGAKTGLEWVYKYYTKFRISQRGAPVALAIGVSLNFQAWLTGFRVETTDPQTGLAQFAMRFNFFPGRLVTNPSSDQTFLDSSGGSWDFEGSPDSGGGDWDFADFLDSGGGDWDFPDTIPLQNPLGPGAPGAPTSPYQTLPGAPPPLPGAPSLPGAP
jgi:hypothetical protein